MLRLTLVTLLIATAAHADDGTQRRLLAASLFGETVGEVRLTLLRGPIRTLMTYRSELRVVREFFFEPFFALVESAHFAASCGPGFRKVAINTL